MIRGVRTWWRPLGADGGREFVVIAEKEGVETWQGELGYRDWQEVTPVEFYEAALELEAAKADPDDNWVETLEETIELWRKHDERAGGSG